MIKSLTCIKNDLVLILYYYCYCYLQNCCYCYITAARDRRGLHLISRIGNFLFLKYIRSFALVQSRAIPELAKVLSYVYFDCYYQVLTLLRECLLFGFTLLLKNTCLFNPFYHYEQELSLLGNIPAQRSFALHLRLSGTMASVNTNEDLFIY